ncbi:hypothetical protein SAMN04488504_104381 [Myxococcus virescens]|uniref:Uncharacterized protein n=1 Tax=Myxococcus virescens TaxID=83456 RepID=A0ABY0MPF5_9BACT|nr:hypothetical protein SAMN04488504_104381 [Myxococcus virescens]
MTPHAHCCWTCSRLRLSPPTVSSPRFSGMRPTSRRCLSSRKTPERPCKPSSVPTPFGMGGEHSSRALVAQGPHQRATRTHGTGHPCPPYGEDALLLALAPGGVYRAVRVTPDAVRSYRTVSPLPAPCGTGGLFSVALSCESPRLAVSQHPALWSSDFPPATHDCGDRRSPGPLRHLALTTAGQGRSTPGRPPGSGTSASARAGGGPREEQRAFSRVPRESGGLLELRAGLVEPAQLAEQVSADAGQQVVALE